MNKEIEAVCPECGYAVDDATGVGDAAGDRPEEGNVAVCIRCGGIGLYVENGNGTLGLRPATDDEKVKLSDDVELTKVRAAIIAQEIWMKK